MQEAQTKETTRCGRTPRALVPENLIALADKLRDEVVMDIIAAAREQRSRLPPSRSAPCSRSPTLWTSRLSSTGGLGRHQGQRHPAQLRRPLQSSSRRWGTPQI